MARLRELGVIGKNAPTRKTKTVVASDFSIAGLIGFFERRYKKAFEINDPGQKQLIFGNQINPNWYGDDCFKGFFDNLAGVNGTLWIKAHVGNDGAAYDAVTATAKLDDQQTVAEKILQLDSAYREELEFSASGNRTGYTITNGSRFLTNVTGSSSTTTLIYVNSVVGIIVGDIVSVGLSGGDEYSKVSAIDESAKTITLSSALSLAPAATDAVNVLGFRLRTYRQSVNGIVTEVDEDLGEVWCTTESEVADFFVENVFKISSWVKASVLTTTPTNIEDTFPVDVATVTYLAGGSNGTSPTTVNQWAFDNSSFDGLPVRWITNVETADESIQKAGEAYCKARNDTPIWVTALLRDQDKEQLIEAGNAYQRSDDVFQTLIGSWLGVTDPFTTNPNAADRAVPSAGHVMGLWVRTIAVKGIHYIPTKDLPILGVNSVIEDSLGVITNRDRTDIAQAGVNLIQFISGTGFVLRNLFTPSTATDFQFANGILMRNFIKISAQDSLQNSENTPNSFNQIKTDRDAVYNFMYGLWLNGSTGTVATGETFAQYTKTDGSISTFDDSVQINVDPPVNTLTSLQAGERNIPTYFAYPAPAGSIFIKVGILLPA